MSRDREYARNLRWEIGRNMRRIREARGISQREMAKHFDAGEAYYRGIEHGSKDYSLVRLAEIAALLGSSLSELTEGV